MKGVGNRMIWGGHVQRMCGDGLSKRAWHTENGEKWRREDEGWAGKITWSDFWGLAWTVTYEWPLQKWDGYGHNWQRIIRI